MLPDTPWSGQLPQMTHLHESNRHVYCVERVHWKNNTQSVTHTNDSWKPLCWIQAEAWITLFTCTFTTSEERWTSLGHIVMSSLQHGKKRKGLAVPWDFVISPKHSVFSKSVRPDKAAGSASSFQVSLFYLKHITFPFNDSVYLTLKETLYTLLFSVLWMSYPYFFCPALYPEGQPLLIASPRTPPALACPWGSGRRLVGTRERNWTFLPVFP